MYEFVMRFLTTFELQYIECSGQRFQKVKFSGQETGTKKLYDDYGSDVVAGKILYEIELKLDTFISINQRSATKVFDYLGDVGGFAAAFEGVFSVIGVYFSSRYLSSSLASNLYIKRKSSKEIKQFLNQKSRNSKNKDGIKKV